MPGCAPLLGAGVLMGFLALCPFHSLGPGSLCRMETFALVLSRERPATSQTLRARPLLGGQGFGQSPLLPPWGILNTMISLTTSIVSKNTRITVNQEQCEELRVPNKSEAWEGVLRPLRR